MDQIRDLKSNHPFWGYRRIWAHLKYVQKLHVNQKRVYRLMKDHDLTVKPNLKLKALRTPQRSKPRPITVNQWWGIDMTKVLIQGFGWLYVMIVIDWYSKKVVGYNIDMQGTTRHWLSALNMAVNRQFPAGSRNHGVHLMSDNGCQPTSISFMKTCSTLNVHQAFTSYNNPKGNADTERFMRTFKEELVWLKDWNNPLLFIKEARQWFEHYNHHYLHSSLGYKTPIDVETQTLNNAPITLFAIG